MSKKHNLILDLDQTLISSESINAINSDSLKKKSDLFRVDVLDDFYKIFSRPYLQEFLDYAFKNFNVSVWTAASKDYALFIIENIIINNQPERKLDYIFFSYHCDISKYDKKYSKELCMLWENYKLMGYSEKNTVILDDFKDDVHKSQPNNCIIAKPFEFFSENSENDKFLLDLIPQLEKMKERMDENNTNITEDVNINMKTLN
jgi:TFIIF-interacting CTD phosphatase-like protein